MKIAILTSGILPVPAVQGGAVENFLDYFLEYNHQHQLHNITVYSVYHPNVENHPALSSSVNHYHYIDVSSFFAKVRKHLFGYIHKDTHHHYSIEYFLHQSLKHILKNEYDMIVLHNRPGYAEVLIGKTSSKLVYTLYNDKLNSQTRKHQLIYDGASLIISTSNYITDRVKTINDYANKCITVYSGIELQRFNREHVYPHERKSLHLSPDDFVIVFSGRVTPEKGIMELIDAMILLKGHPQIKLLVIGSSLYGNADNKNEFFEKLKKRAENLNDRIIFTGFVPYDQMPQYVSMADIAVIPSVWDDPFPTTVLEAQAIGLPVISTHRGGIPEEVTDETAILLDTDEHFANNLAAAILDLYQHPEKREVMGRAALEHAQLFSKERYAENFFKTISSIIL